MQTPLPTRAGQTAMPAQLTAPRSAPEAPAGTAAPGGKRGRGAKGADRGTGENGGRGGGGGGGKQETSTQPLAITDKSEAGGPLGQVGGVQGQKHTGERGRYVGPHQSDRVARV